jgi:hypothetical protein
MSVDQSVVGRRRSPRGLLFCLTARKALATSVRHLNVNDLSTRSRVYPEPDRSFPAKLTKQ